MAWTCPHCIQPEDRHFYLGRHASLASLVDCLFDRNGLIDPSQYARLYKIVEDWNRMVRGLPSQLFVSRDALTASQKELETLCEKHRLELRDFMETAEDLEKAVIKLQRDKTQEIDSLREAHRRRVEALEAELADARKGATTASAIKALELKISGLTAANGELQKLIAIISDEQKLKEKVKALTRQERDKLKLDSEDPAIRKGLEARVAELEKENAALKSKDESTADLIALNRETESAKKALEERVAELEVELADAKQAAPAVTVSTDFGRCATCGEHATSQFATTLPDGTVERIGACGNAKHLQDAVVKSALKAGKKSSKSRGRADGAAEA